MDARRPTPGDARRDCGGTLARGGCKLPENEGKVARLTRLKRGEKGRRDLLALPCSVYVLTNNRSYSFQSISRINSSGEISSSNWDEWCCEIKVSKFDRGKGFLLYLCEICFLISNGIRWFRNGNVNTIFEVRSSFLR